MSSFFKIGTEEQLIQVLAAGEAVKVPGGVMVKSGARPIRAGELIAVNSSTNLAAGRKSTQLDGVHETTVTDVTVDDAHNFEVGDTIAVGGQTGKVITAINYETNVISIDAQLGAQVADNARVYVSANAQGTAVGVALTPVLDPYDATKANRNGAFVFGDLAIRGIFKSSALKDYNSEAVTDLGSEAELNGTIAVK
jgi:hypothetical protein